MLILQTIQETISTDNKKCDGVQMIFDHMDTLPIENKQYYICDLFRVRNMKIQPTEKYLHIELVDTDSGEQIEINIKRNVHQKLIDRKIYPTQLINIFQKQNP